MCTYPSRVAYLVFAALSSHYLECSIWGQLWGIIQCLLLALAPLLIACFISQRFLSDLPNIVQVILNVVVFGTVYLMIALLTKNKALQYLLEMLKLRKNG